MVWDNHIWASLLDSSNSLPYPSLTYHIFFPMTHLVAGEARCCAQTALLAETAPMIDPSPPSLQGERLAAFSPAPLFRARP